jgi:hypothetical protein
MTLVVTYDEPDARTVLVTTGLVTAGAAIFSIQRGPTSSGPWTGVRGAVNVNVTTDAAQTWYDYEYDAGPNVINYYRVLGQEGPRFIGYGTPGTDATDPYTLTMGWHASTLPGDVLVMALAGATSADPLGFVIPGGGWSYAGGNYFANGAAVEIFIKQVVVGDAGPTVFTLTCGTPIEFIGQIATFRNVRPVVLGTGNRQGPAATNLIGYAALPAPAENHAMVIILGGARDTSWSSAAPPAGFIIIDDPTFFSALGANLVWAYQVQGLSAALVSGSFTAASGSYSTTEKTGASMMLAYDAVTAASTELFTGSVATPLSVVWLKDPLAPPRNMIVQVGSPTQIRDAARSGLFDIKDRAEPVEISEIRRARNWTQRWIFTTFPELDALLTLFAPGRTLLLHVPARGTVPVCEPWPRNLPGGFIYVGDISEEPAPDAAIPGVLVAPVQVVAAPVPELDYVEVPVP